MMALKLDPTSCSTQGFTARSALPNFVSNALKRVSYVAAAALRI